MSYIEPILGEKILVKLGDGESPEIFTAPNVINTTRGISFSTSTETDELIDLADQSAPAQTIRRVKSTDTKIDGSGMLDHADVPEWIEWSLSGKIRNVQAIVGNVIVEGPFVLTSFAITGDRLKSATCDLTLEQAGAVSQKPIA
ncbi:phage tail tube protein [Novosphingobium sp.]|jgi:predicted secreted protein|uniref:phage tail tube protein n=1 Tax=Novosphingobium sp. TaxID=1874826 RepID=UPI002FE167B9